MSKVQNSSLIAKNTLLLYFRMLFLMAVTLYTSRVVLEVLGVEDFGIYNVVGGVVSLFAFLNGALTSATQRFLSFELGKKNDGDVQKVFSASIIVHILISLFVVILAETIGLWFFYSYLNIPDARMNAAFWVYQFSVLTFSIKILQVPYNASIITYERMKFYTYVSILEVGLLLFIVFSLKWINYEKLILYAGLIFSVSVIVFVAYRTFCKRKFPSCTYKKSWNSNLIKELVSFSGWSLFGSLAFVLKAQGVNILLNIFFGPTVNAARAITFQIQSAMQSFVLNFQTAVRPQIVKLYASDNINEMRNLVFKSSKYGFFLMLFLAFPVIVEMDYILKFWLPLVPKYSNIFATLILSEVIMDSFSGPLMAAVQATGKIRNYQIIIGGILLLNLPLSYITLKLSYPPQSVFVISLGVTLFAFIIRLILMKSILNFDIYIYIKEVLIRSFLVMMLTFIIVFWIKNSMESGFVRLVVVTLGATISNIIFIYFIAMDSLEKQFFKLKIKNIISKF